MKVNSLSGPSTPRAQLTGTNTGLTRGLVETVHGTRCPASLAFGLFAGARAGRRFCAVLIAALESSRTMGGEDGAARRVTRGRLAGVGAQSVGLPWRGRLRGPGRDCGPPLEPAGTPRGRGARSRGPAARTVSADTALQLLREAHGELDTVPRPSAAVLGTPPAWWPQPRRTPPPRPICPLPPSSSQPWPNRPQPALSAAAGGELSPAQCVLYAGVAGPCARRSGSRRRSCLCRRRRCR